MTLHLADCDLLARNDIIRLARRILQLWVVKSREIVAHFGEGLQVHHSDDVGYTPERHKALVKECSRAYWRQNTSRLLDPLRKDLVGLLSTNSWFPRVDLHDVYRGVYSAILQFSPDAIITRDPDAKSVRRLAFHLAEAFNELVASPRVSSLLSAAWIEFENGSEFPDFERVPDILWWNAHSTIRCDNVSFHGTNARLRACDEVRTKLRLRFEAKTGEAAFSILCNRIKQSGRVLFRLIDELQHDPKKATPSVGKLPLIESTTLDRYAPLLTTGFGLFCDSPANDLDCSRAASLHMLYEAEGAVGVDSRTVLKAAAAEALVCKSPYRDRKGLRCVCQGGKDNSINERFARRLAAACSPEPGKLDALASDLREAYLMRGTIAHGKVSADSGQEQAERLLGSAVARLHWAIQGWLSARPSAKNRTHNDLIAELDTCWESRKRFAGGRWLAEWNGADLNEGRTKYPEQVGPRM